MKKSIVLLFSAVLLLTLAGCGPVVSSLPQTSPTLTSILNAGGDVDLQNSTYAENASVNTADITIENADLGGKILTVNAPGVTLRNISNADLVIGAGVDDGDVFVESCAFNTVTVNGGGANSIHFRTTTITHVDVQKHDVRVVLEEGTAIETAKINADNAKLEAAVTDEEDETAVPASVGTLEVADDTDGVVIQKVTATAVVIKENVKNVTVEEVAAEKIEVRENAQNTVIKNTTVTTIEIEKEVEKIKIEACAVTTAKVSNDANSVEVAGGTVETLQVIKTKVNADVKAVITVTTTDTIISDAKVVVKSGQIITEQQVPVALSDEVDEAAVQLPPAVEVVTVTGIAFDASLVSADYKTGAEFNPANACLLITYSNGTTKKVSVPAADITVTGFDSSSAVDNQSVTLSTTYDGLSYDDTIYVTISARPDYIGRGIDLILAGNYDEGVAKFYEAYEDEQTDQNKMFWCLAQLASLSTNKTVADLLKNNFAFEEYPATMNALLSTDWLQETPTVSRVSCHTITENENGSCFRCSIDETEEIYEYRIWYILDEDGDWLSADTYDSETSSWTEMYITGVAIPDPNGEYMIWDNEVQYPYLANTRFTSQPQNAYTPVAEGTPRYESGNNYYKSVLDGNSTLLPKIRMSDWFTSSQDYQNNLVHGIITEETVSEALLAGILDCNPDGINDIIDDAIKVFDNQKMTEVHNVAASITGPVAIPEQIIEIFNLAEILGTDEIYIGKSELNLIISALDIIKGTLQYISSYDLSANLGHLKELMITDTSITAEMAENIISSKTLAVRDAAAINRARTTWCNVLDTILVSYDNLFGSNSAYPEAVVQMVTGFGDMFRPGVVSLRNAIKNGTIFYIPMEDGFPSWNRSPDTRTDMGFDFGKFFTPGYFSKFIQKKADGHAELYVKVKTWYWMSTDNLSLIPAGYPYTDNGYGYYSCRKEVVYEYIKLSSFNEEQFIQNQWNEFKASGFQTGDIDIYIGYMVDEGLIADLFVNCPEITSNMSKELLDIIDPIYYYTDSAHDEGFIKR